MRERLCEFINSVFKYYYVFALCAFCKGSVCGREVKVDILMELYGHGSGIDGSSTDRVAEWATPGQETGLEGLLCWFAFDF